MELPKSIEHNIIWFHFTRKSIDVNIIYTRLLRWTENNRERKGATFNSADAYWKNKRVSFSTNHHICLHFRSKPIRMHETPLSNEICEHTYGCH